MHEIYYSIYFSSPFFLSLSHLPLYDSSNPYRAKGVEVLERGKLLQYRMQLVAVLDWPLILAIFKKSPEFLQTIEIACNCIKKKVGGKEKEREREGE